MKRTNASADRIDLYFFSVSSDRLGLYASIACLVHCLALPVAAMLGSAWLEGHEGHGSHGLEHHFWHLFFGGVALFAVITASKHAEFAWIKALMWAGWVVFALGEGLHEWDSAHVLTYLGSILLVVAHLVNMRYHRC